MVLTKDQRQQRKLDGQLYGRACQLHDSGEEEEARAILAGHPDLLERLANRPAMRAMVLKELEERQQRWAADHREYERQRAEHRRPNNLQHVIETPMCDLRFKHFAYLKSGRDRFTAMRLDQLRAEVDPVSLATVTTAIEDEKSLAVALRWMLRGLDAEKSIRKARTDAEVAGNAMESKTTPETVKQRRRAARRRRRNRVAGDEVPVDIEIV